MTKLVILSNNERALFDSPAKFNFDQRAIYFALDQKILRAVRSAKFKPYKENGVAYPIRAEQPFELTLNPNG